MMTSTSGKKPRAGTMEWPLESAEEVTPARVARLAEPVRIPPPEDISKNASRALSSSPPWEKSKTYPSPASSTTAALSRIGRQWTSRRRTAAIPPARSQMLAAIPA